MKMIYQVEDKPKFGALIVFAIQQILAIMTATLVVPVIINSNSAGAGGAVSAMDPAAAMFGAGVGTLVYILFTAKKSPVFLGSSFAFIGSMTAAFAGAVSAGAGYAGIILGAIFAGLVYVFIALMVKIAGVNWINRLMPVVVIGPTVALIGLSLAGNAVGDLMSGGVKVNNESVAAPAIAVLAGLVTLTVTILCSTYGKKMVKLIPFIIGILSGYLFCTIITLIGNAAGVDAMKLISFDAFKALTADGVNFGTFIRVPDFTFLSVDFGAIDAAYVGTIAVAYIPVAFVVFAEHLADHKNISSIIERDLLEKPGLHRTLLGDGVGSMVGAIFGGCPNTTYGESVGCVAITRNASVYTIIAAAVGAILISFVSPFIAFVNTVPPCVMGGVCMALYGFIAVSGLKMIQQVDLGKDKNLFVVSTILISGIGGLTLTFGKVTLTSIACALILGIFINLILKNAPDEEVSE